jgi:hypothetical protein
MGGERQTADTAMTQVDDSLRRARLKAGEPLRSQSADPRGLMALQRSVGNAAINALMAAGRPSLGTGMAVFRVGLLLLQFIPDPLERKAIERGERPEPKLKSIWAFEVL